MDPLSDLLSVVRLSGAYFYTVEVTEPWSVETLAAAELSPRVMSNAEHLISYHVVTRGRCYAGLLGEEQIEIGPGDVIVFPHGDAHFISSERGVPVGNNVLSVTPAKYPFTLQHDLTGANGASFVCGFLGCDIRPFNPLLAALPRILHMPALPNASLGALVQQVSDESQLRRAGGHCVITRLAELMFIEVIRRYLDELPAEQVGWLAALRDGVVGRALTQIHARPSHRWTLAALAHDSGSSRTNLAKRFTQYVGQPPIQYLTQWRLQLAANLLAQTGLKISAISSEVGYESEAAFSRAFKRATSFSPAAWRTQRRSPRL